MSPLMIHDIAEGILVCFDAVLGLRLCWLAWHDKDVTDYPLLWLFLLVSLWLL